MSETAKKRIISEEQGFTLPEILVTMLIMITVMFALYSIFDMSIKVFSFGNDKVEAVENARLGVEKMEREVRAAYPVDAIKGRQHVFFNAADPNTPARPPDRSITFGNDLSQGAVAPNRRIVDSGTGTVDSREVITYQLLHKDGGACPATGTEGICKLQRITNAGSATVVDYVMPNGLSFKYFRGRPDAIDPNNLEPATAADGTDIGIVRIKLQINKDGRTQTLTTDVDLRNRGG